MSAAPDAKGLKRVCTECGIRFYDLNKRPIVCPNCEAEFTGVEKVKTRRGRSKADPEEGQVAEKKVKEVANDDDDDEDEDDPGVEEMSLDDLESAEGSDDDDDDASPDLDLDDDDLDDLDVDLDDGPDLDDDDDDLDKD